MPSLPSVAAFCVPPIKPHRLPFLAPLQQQVDRLEAFFDLRLLEC